MYNLVFFSFYNEVIVNHSFLQLITQMCSDIKVVQKSAFISKNTTQQGYFDILMHKGLPYLHFATVD